jgi:DNA-binding NtrC family response regulator
LRSNMKNILLVDDDAQVGETLAQLFDPTEYKFFYTTEGEAAIEMIGTTNADLVLLDVNLPTMSGLEVLKQIKAQQLDVPVIVISGFVSTENAIKAMREGAYEYVTKPFQMERLMLTISKAIGDKPSDTSTVDDIRQSAGMYEDEIIGKSPEIVEIAKLIGQVAQSEASVLIFGESGTGKELVARAIHRNSKRRDNAFLSVNCAALPDTLLESELFGHEKGAYTGAHSRKLGKFELADRGTLFLDEVADMSLTTQSKLLRVLQDGTFERVGGESTLEVDVRVLAATNRSLVTAMKENKFRVDLFYRLKVVSIYLPPLRERRSDIPLLIDHFVKMYSSLSGKRVQSVSKEAMQLLINYHWPGNVRELENNVHTAVVMGKGEILKPDDFPIASDDNETVKIDYEAIQDDYSRMFDDLLEPIFDRILNVSAGQVFYHLQAALEQSIIKKTLSRQSSNQVKTAQILGISRNTLRDRMQKYEIF